MRTKAGRKPPTTFRPSHHETPEAWWIEVTPTRFGFESIAKSNHDRRLGRTENGVGGFHIWRPTERWAERAARRVLRQWKLRQALERTREERTRVFPVRD